MTTMRLLTEGISHVEDLPIDEFIDVLRNLSTMKAQEKLDGANLWTGIDEKGVFYTSREGKRQNADRRYSADDWPKVGALDQFRAAHLALEQRQNEMKLVLQPGDTVEVEVLYGAQPNSVTYGADGMSYIAFLRGVNGTPDGAADHLSQMLANQQVEVKFDAVDTKDGETLEFTPVAVKFRFTAPHEISPEKLRDASIEKELKQLESFLRAASPMQGLSNGELAKLQLTAVPKESRAVAKEARAEVLAKIQTDFKLPIKQALLDKLVRRLKSGLSDPDKDGVGIEGIVLRDPKTGTQVKIVDKDVFTAINKFNQSARGEVLSALNTTDPDAPLESRGGVVGELRIKIADTLGNREFAKPSNLRKALMPMRGETPEDTIKAFAKSLNIDDFQAVKRKILAMTAETAKMLAAKLQFFKDNQENYELKLKDGREMGLSDETIKKTLVSFAEARRSLEQLFEKIKGTKSLAQLLATLYGSQAKAVHAEPEAEKPVQESLLVESRGELDVDTYRGKSDFDLVNSYLATVFMTMVIYHVDDTLGMRRLRDRPNYQLKKHTDDMSPLNHWGYVIWRANTPAVKKLITTDAEKKLARIIKDIPKPWWKFLHMDFSFDRQVVVDWKDHKKTLKRLIELAGLRSDRLNTMLDMSVHFGDLELKDQKKLIKMLNSYAHRFVPRSSLFVRTKVIAGKLKDAEEKMVSEGLLKSIATLAEDEGGGDAGGAIASPSVTTAGTSAAAIASTPIRLLDTRRRVEKRKRNPAVKELTMKFKDPRKDETQ